jgi:site-specific recombinase XerD
MGALRIKMIEEMRLRNFSSRTEQAYVSAMVGLVKYYQRSPDQLTQDQIRAYLLHLKERGLSASSRNVAISGMKFFYHQILGWNEQRLFLPPRKRSWRLPEVLSPKGSRALAVIRSKTSGPLSFDDGLRHGVAGERIGAAQSERHRQ